MLNAENLKPKDVKDFLVAFAAIEAPPSAKVVNTVILRLAAGGLQGTNPRDLSLLLGVRCPARAACTCRAWCLRRSHSLYVGVHLRGKAYAALDVVVVN